MSTRKDRLFVRIEPELTEVLQLELEKRQKAQPGLSLTRSDVVREILWQVLLASKEEGKK